MKKIISLTKVFIKEFYQNMPIFDKFQKKFNKKSMIFWLMAIVFFSIAYLSYEAIYFLKEIGQEPLFLNLYFLILGIVILFQTILICANIFFFSKDLEKVLPMPIRTIELLMAKFNTVLAMIYLTEAIIAFIPLTLYGFVTQAHILFFIWEILILIFFPVLLVIIVSIIMLLIMRFAKFMRNKDIFQIVITIIMITLLCIIQMKAMNELFETKEEGQIEQEIQYFNQKTKQVGNYLLVVNPSIEIMSNPNKGIAVISFLKILCYEIIGGTIFVLLGKMTYLKDILQNMVNPAKKRRKKIKIKKFTECKSKRKAYFIKEIKNLIREPIFFMQCVFPVMIILVTVIMFLIALQPLILEILKEEEIHNAIQNLSLNTEGACDILIVMQILFTISTISLTAISREGKNAFFVKCVPIEFYKQFIYKNIPQIILNFIVEIVILGVVGYFIPTIEIEYFIILFAIGMFISFINSYLMLMIDLRRPNLDWDTAHAVVKRNDNKVFQYAFMIGNVVFLMYLAKLLEEMNILFALLTELAIFAILFLILDRVVKKWQNKLFNKII